MLATADREIGRHTGEYVDFGFTRDDSHVYALDDTGRVAVVETDSGAMLPQRLECHCTRIFPLTGTTVGWWQEPDTYLRADLLSPKPVAAMSISLPQESVAPGNVLSAPRLLTADQRTLIIDRVESPRGASWGINHLSAVDADTAAARPLDTMGTGVNTAFATAALRPDGRAVTLSGYARDGNTCGTARLVRIDLARDRTETFDPPWLAPCSALTDLRWHGSEPIITNLSWEPNAPDHTTATAVWIQQETRWDRQGGNDTLRRASLTPVVTLEIRRTGRDRVRTVHSGALLLLAGTDARVLAHNVVDLRLPYGEREPPADRPPPRLRSATDHG
ncbi:hypothetical protein [Nocardia sp. N2S4-5]|uniref:hypothetical protein n=1 Tax=Nocardia sp. N2S4-5 TaxID=3351565 RepID=UPI0037CCE24E